MTTSHSNGDEQEMEQQLTHRNLIDSTARVMGVAVAGVALGRIAVCRVARKARSLPAQSCTSIVNHG